MALSKLVCVLTETDSASYLWFNWQNLVYWLFLIYDQDSLVLN